MESEHAGSEHAATRVQSILAAAEHTAEELRGHAEERASERIAEADRAAINRIKAAEEEASEIGEAARAQVQELLRNARAEAEGLLEQTRGEASELLEQTQAEASALLQNARAEANELQQNARAAAERQLSAARQQVGTLLEGGAEELARQRAEEQRQAEEKTQQMRTNAREEARAIVGDAYTVAHEVQREGSEIAGNLRDLSASLRNNAERLLRDVRLAHGSMTARLDQAAPGATSRRRPTQAPPGEDLEVPEFMPRE